MDNVIETIEVTKAEIIAMVDAAIAATGEECSPERRESLIIAAEMGADGKTLEQLARATRLARKSTIVLPASRFEGLSRGRGWCRLGRGDRAQWGEETKGGYRVSDCGRWTVYGSDGFRREERVDWDVRRIAVGSDDWTIAE